MVDSRPTLGAGRRLRSSHLLLTVTQPQPQLLLAGGLVAEGWDRLLDLVTRLPISFTSFWSGLSARWPLDQDGGWESGSLQGWPVQA